MRVFGLVRTVLAWVVGAPLLAAALGGPLLWLWLRADDNQAHALAITTAPLCAALGTLFASRTLVGLSRADPRATPAAVAAAFRQQGVDPPQVLVCAALAPGEVLVVRSLRCRYVFLPPALDGSPDAAAVPEAVRQMRRGQGCVVPIYVAVCGWHRGWVDATTSFLAALIRADLSFGIRVQLVPFVLLAGFTAPMAAVSYVAAAVLTFVVGPGTARRVSRVLGTEHGRPRQVQVRRYSDGNLSLRQGNSLAFRSGFPELRDVPSDPAGQPVGGFGLPRAVGAGLAPMSQILQVPTALMIVLVAYLAAVYPAQRLLWPGERAVAAQVVQADYGSAATRYLSVRVDGSSIPPPVTSQILVAGQSLTLVARVGTTDRYRDPQQSSAAQIAVGLAFALLLALLGAYVWPRSLIGPEHEPGPSAQENGHRPSTAAGLVHAWPVWVGALIASMLVGLGGGALGELAGRPFGAVDAARTVGLLVGFVGSMALLGALLVRSVLSRRDPLGPGSSSRAATGSRQR